MKSPNDVLGLILANPLINIEKAIMQPAFP